jgi:hypothetical protein
MGRKVRRPGRFEQRAGKHVWIYDDARWTEERSNPNHAVLAQAYRPASAAEAFPPPVEHDDNPLDHIPVWSVRVEGSLDVRAMDIEGAIAQVKRAQPGLHITRIELIG